jgi:hypothetical protein
MASFRNKNNASIVMLIKYSLSMKTSALFLLMALSVGLNAQKEKSISCLWRESATQDMRSRVTEFIYSQKGQFYYYLSNDRENLYVDLRFFEKEIQNAVMRSGLTLWINMDGKKEKNVGIRYPLVTRNSERPPSSATTGGITAGQAPGRNRNNQAPDLNILELVGFSESGPVQISASENNNVRGSIKYENDGMWYEVVIPFNKMPQVAQKNKKNTITFGFEYVKPVAAGQYGGQGAPGGGGGGRSGGGAPGGGGGGRGGAGGGGMPAGGQGGAAPGGPASIPPQIIWITNITLASEK